MRRANLDRLYQVLLELTRYLVCQLVFARTRGKELWSCY
jgi:hypothetical protein